MTRDEYVRHVDWWLRDLPWSTRQDLLAELRGHLDELPADTDFRAQLGTPETYAGDLRAAAGLERRRGLIAFLRARRPRNLILFVLALTVAGLAIGAVAWIDRYQPIVYGNATQFPPDSKPSPGQPGVTVVFRRGRPFLYGVTIRNSGRFPVRVLGVPQGCLGFLQGSLAREQAEPERERAAARTLPSLRPAPRRDPLAGLEGRLRVYQRRGRGRPSDHPGRHPGSLQLPLENRRQRPSRPETR